MIAHILEKPSRSFAGVGYNTGKIDRNTGELMLIANFGALQALQNPRPQDLVNYLKMISSRERAVKNTQFHAVISARGRTYSKQELTEAAVMWLKEMKYGEQPYLIVFHKDTDNHHVHLVSSRVGKNGKLIDCAYEKVRAVRNMDQVLGYTFALQYRFSTAAQFYLILESQGFLGREYYNEQQLQQKIAAFVPDQARIAEVKNLLEMNKAMPDLVQLMKSRHQVDVVFHAKDGKRPYGYTVIDHATKQVFKGSEVLNLKYLLDENHTYTAGFPQERQRPIDFADPAEVTYYSEVVPDPVYIRPVSIADDVDDQQIHGMRRRRQKKARTNTR